ncbi:hypothetical protein R1flu_001563 [Riccia fluitans]|uniref:Exostosin GT47 domain-containing protein n=1 Tax=Riccia fluitans TaxID=41844 RepID=A0ABD1Y3L8_9MARC
MKLLEVLRKLKYHRMTLVPAICLLIFVWLWMSTSLALINFSHYSLSQDTQCTSCTNNDHALLTTPNFPSYIKDVILRTSRLSTAQISSFQHPSRTSNKVAFVEKIPDKKQLQELILKSGAANSNERRVSQKSSKPNSEVSQCLGRSSACVKVEPELGKIPSPFSNGGDSHNSDSRLDEGVSKAEKPDEEDLQTKQLDGPSNSRGNRVTPSAAPRKQSTGSGDAGEGGVMFKHENMTAADLWEAKELEKMMRHLRESALPTSKSSHPSVILQGLYVRYGTPQGTIAPNLPSCDGRYIYVYNLPRKFNADLIAQCDTLENWVNLCDYLQHDGMGLVLNYTGEEKEAVLTPEGSWHMTHQHLLEPIFHARMRSYDCLTTDESTASLFYIPYYGALDENRWEFAENATNEDRDALPLELVHWLEEQESWKRNNGLDHVLLLGDISWDFRRTERSNWGSKLLRLPQMDAPTKLLIERQVWDPTEIGVPYPTSFHPSSGHEIRAWQSRCEESERRYLVSFAGMPRPNMLGNIRGQLIRQCLDNPKDCFFLRCEHGVCYRPDSTMDLFLHSHFCMQPPGDSPSRRSMFDSLIGGCIPVLFNPYSAYYQYPWHLPEYSKSFSVYIPSKHVMSGRANVIEILKTISAQERTEMRARIIQDILPGLLYSKPGAEHPSFRDAFDITVEGLLQRVENLRAEKAAAIVE